MRGKEERLSTHRDLDGQKTRLTTREHGRPCVGNVDKANIVK